MNDRTIVGWVAAILGILGEGALVWFLDQLPLWAQLFLFVPVGCALLYGFYLILAPAIRRRLGMAPPAAARLTRAAAAKPTKPAKPRPKGPPPPPPRPASE